jgi:hypothetical protein
MLPSNDSRGRAVDRPRQSQKMPGSSCLTRRKKAAFRGFPQEIVLRHWIAEGAGMNREQMERLSLPIGKNEHVAVLEDVATIDGTLVLNGAEVTLLECRAAHWQCPKTVTIMVDSGFAFYQPHAG